MNDPLTPNLPSQIGPFHILSLLGTGGMGEVYLAEQLKPIKRRVALKVVKAGMDTKEVIARFESERQALALMNHPNVAQIFDAGTTENGYPYFVMEYAPGEAITEYCDRHKLNLRERLALFIPVCQAIQHAHQKGIIHRDIKPSNVLVAIEDGKPVPKVIDFGVAKATQQALTEKTMYTVQGNMIGTPAYMSPEQAEMTGLNVDTTSDVYSLGVLLYELLVGTQPFDAQELRQAGIAEIHRIIRDVDPPKPSTKINTFGDETTVLASKRHTGPRNWHKQLNGELDWITMRALEKDRMRRYQSASEFANDVERYLQGQPVLARRPSTIYQLQKLINRHKTRFALLALVIVVMIGSSIKVSLQSRQIAHERDRASQEAEAATQVSSFLVDLFNVSDPNESMGNTITAREILDRGVTRIETELAGQPLIKAKLMQTMADVYRSLALYPPATSLLREAIDIRRRELGPNDPSVATTMNSLAVILRETGDYKNAQHQYETILAMQRITLGDEHPDVATTLNNLGVVLRDLHDFDGARKRFTRVLSIYENIYGPNHTKVANVLNNLALVASDTGDYAEARRIYERALSIKEKNLGPDHPRVATTLSNLAIVLKRTGQFDEARALYERSLAINEKALGPDHPRLANTLNNLAFLLTGLGEYEAARIKYERALNIYKSAYGPDHPYVGQVLYNLACNSALADQAEPAIAYLNRYITLTGDGDGPDITEDTDLNSLHGNPAYEAAIASWHKAHHQ